MAHTIIDSRTSHSQNNTSGITDVSEHSLQTRKAHDGFMANSIAGKNSERQRAERIRGRAANINPAGRFEPISRHVFDDGWQTLDELPPFKTEVLRESAKTIITRNTSPDISFDRSINPYRGCEHGCVYCYARPSHSYMGLSAGLDFETKLFAKPGAATLLEDELSKKGYKPKTIAIGTNTDPYQPIEKEWRVTREILEVLEKANHPVGIVTKSSLVIRDIDILSRMAEKNLVKIAISITTLDRKLARTMEPRASTPSLRLKTINDLSQAGIPTSVLVAPIIPALNDHEMERILDSARGAGAISAGFVLLRLPFEVSPIFREWLLKHYPDKYRHVMSILRSMRGGKDYDAKWNQRMSGQGPYAIQIARRFELVAKRLGFNQRRTPLNYDLFKVPKEDAQLALF